MKMALFLTTDLHGATVGMDIAIPDLDNLDPEELSYINGLLAIWKRRIHQEGLWP